MEGYAPSLNHAVPEGTLATAVRLCFPRHLVHKRTDGCLQRCQDRQGEDHVLFILGAVIVWVVIVLFRRLRTPRVTGANLGWMSERWLAEHRASHLP